MERRTRDETKRRLLSPSFNQEQLLVKADAKPSELVLLWELVWPLFFQTLANELQMVLTMALYGHMGETDLATANDTNSMVWFALVFVGGAQNVVYTMAPQAKGADNRRQVGIVLQVTLFWTCVVLAPLTAVAVYNMGQVLLFFDLVELGTDEGSGSYAASWWVDNKGMTEGEAVVSFSHASAWWILPYVLTTTVTTWLDAISVVQAPSFIAAIWAVLMVALAYWFMYKGVTMQPYGRLWDESPNGLGINGFAYAAAICYCAQFLTLYLYVFVWRKLHVEPGKEVWFGWEPKRVLNKKLNCRFLWLAVPMMLQYALNSWTSTVFQLFMSSRSTTEAAAYGVTSTYVSTGGSVSNALFMAVSTRVGECLGEGNVHRAKTAALAGFFVSLAAGAVISSGIFFARKPLAEFYVGDAGADVAQIAIEASPFVVLYYLINSATWGLWAIMQGQMRTCFPASVICIGMWCGSVPLTYASITLKLDERLGIRPVVMLWVCCCVGEGVSCLMMAVAVWCSDWESISREAIQSAAIGEDDDDKKTTAARAKDPALLSKDIFASSTSGEAAGRGRQQQPAEGAVGRPRKLSEPEWWTTPTRQSTTELPSTAE